MKIAKMIERFENLSNNLARQRGNEKSVSTSFNRVPSRTGKRQNKHQQNDSEAYSISSFSHLSGNKSGTENRKSHIEPNAIQINNYINNNNNNKESGDVAPNIIPFENSTSNITNKQGFGNSHMVSYSFDIRQFKNSEKSQKRTGKQQSVGVDLLAIKELKDNKNIDTIVKKSIKKVKEKQRKRLIEKIQQEEKMKQDKEMQTQLNKAIRDMNAKSLSRSKIIQESQISKNTHSVNKIQPRIKIINENITKHKPIPTEAERRANLGLKFIEISRRIKKKKSESIPGKPSKNQTISHIKNNKDAIHKYMEIKKSRIENEKKRQKSVEREQKNKISQNMAKLKGIVNGLFSQNKPERKKNYDGSFDSSSHKINKTIKPKGSHKKRDKNYSELLTGIIQNEQNNFKDFSGPVVLKNEEVMESIRENLLQELTGGDENELQKQMFLLAGRFEKILSNCNNNEDLPLKSDQKSDNKNSEKMQNQDKKHIDDTKNLTEELKKSIETEKDNENKELFITSPIEETNPSGSYDVKNIGKILNNLQMKSDNEKIVTISGINTIEDEKQNTQNLQKSKEINPAEFTLPVQEKPNKTPIKSKTIETQTGQEEPTSLSHRIKTNAEIKGISSSKKNTTQKSIPEDNKSLAEMRLLIGSEKLLQENAEQIVIENNFASPDSENNHNLKTHSGIYDLDNSSQLQESLFERNPFRDFTQKKIKEIVQSDNLSKLITMREKVMKYKEATEKRYIQKMFKAKQFSPRTYQRKRKELEKWVTSEREEIKKSKKSVNETWQKTAEMIEEAQKNSLQLKRILASHALSYNSETNSMFSLLMDSSRSQDNSQIQDNNSSEIINEPKIDKLGFRHDKSLDDLSDVLNDNDDSMVRISDLRARTEPKKATTSSNPILIQDNNSPEDNKSIASNELAKFAIPSPNPEEIKKSDSVKSKEILIEDHLDSTPSLKNSKDDALMNLLLNSETNSQNRPSIEDDANANNNEIIWEVDVLNKKHHNLSNTPNNEKINVTPTTETNQQSLIKSLSDITSEISPPVQSLIIDIQKGQTTESVNVHPVESKTIKEKAEEIAANLYTMLISELAEPNLFPKRILTQSNISSPLVQKKPPSKQENDPLKDMGKDKNPHNRILQSLAYGQRKGIPSDANFIGNYLDDLFRGMLRGYKQHFITEVNRAIPKGSLDLLTEIESGEIDSKNLLPHEMHPIIPEAVFMQVEKKRELMRKGGNELVPMKEGCKKAPLSLAECEKIHNRAIFDSVNEALNLIRPYGLNGEPTQWSLQQRILFKSITDPNIITRNIKNMVLDWASFEVGTLPKPEFLTNGRFDEDYFAEVREKRLANMLAQEVISINSNLKRLLIMKKLL